MKQQVVTRQLHDTKDWWETGDEPVQWLVAPECLDLAEFLRGRGFCMIDRTIRATIPLKKGMDFSRFRRIPLEELERPTERIYEIAGQSFLLDSRFFAMATAGTEELRKRIRAFVDGMGAFFVCRCRGEIAGFLEVVRDEDFPDKQASIRLAAVDEAYRAAGAALSLYAGAAEQCRQQGIQRLWGRISSRNMAVMNLYAALGASFSLPQDVYVRRRAHAGGTS